MTSGRFWFPTCTLMLAGALLSASPGCGGGGSPCTNCPPLEGRYALELQEGTLPTACNGLTVTLPKGPLDVEQRASDVAATLDGMTLRGTLYNTYNFNLLGNSLGAADGGTGGPDSASLSGRYIPAVGDGGVPRLEGSWQGNFSGASGGGTRRCTVTRSFTATPE